MMRKFNFGLMLSLVLLLSIDALAGVKYSGAGFTIYPKRLVLNAKNPSSLITVYNRGDNTMVVSIKTRDVIFDENSVKKIVTNSTNSFGRSLRYSPRKVTLKPHSEQNVRVMLRSPRKFKNKEFSTRIVFLTSSPKEKRNDKIDEGLSLNIDVGLSSSSPVIYWPEGVVQSKAIPKNIKTTFEDDNLVIKYQDIRDGEASTLYDTKYIWINPDGKEIEIGNMFEHTLYFPTKKLNRKKSIENISKFNLDKNGKLKIINTNNSVWY